MRKLILIIVLFVASCSKDELKTDLNTNAPDPLSNTIAGRWVGEYDYGNDVEVYYCIFNIKNDSTLEELDKKNNVIGVGTWSLNGNKFNASYFPLTYHAIAHMIDAELNMQEGKLDGSWGYQVTAAYTGKFTLTKANEIK